MKTILFSGGYDSSYLLWKEVKKAHDTGEEINVIYVDGNFLGINKVTREKEAREKIINYLKAKYYNAILHTNELIIDWTKMSNINNLGLAQPLFWIPTVILTSNIEDNEIMMSYICGDQALSKKEDIVNIFNSVNNMQISIERKFKFSFPLEMTYKEEIISKLVEFEPFIFENATTCESMKEEDFCGECVPCRNLKGVIVNIIVDKETKDSTREYLKSFLKNKFNLSLEINDLSNSDKCDTVEDTKLIENEDCKRIINKVKSE